jgi:amino acid transporter
MASSQLKRILIGTPFPLSSERLERLDTVRGLAIFASDTISSNAYATEAIMGILVVLGSGALSLAWPIALAIAALVGVVVFSYVQTIMHYPRGGGAYFVAKDNLGVTPSLLAAGAILPAYILTVAVSVAAGVRAVTSAFPGLIEFRVPLALAVVVLITWINLRGLRESGTIFALPTYAFTLGVLVVIAIGLARHFGWFGAAPLPVQPEGVVPTADIAGLAYAWLILRAFSAGCTALTGIEAVADGVQAFKPPEPVNAIKVMITMGLLSMALFLGISYLATNMRIVPTQANSVLSQMTEQIVGKGFLYYWVQVFTAFILFLAANTGYQDFPRLSAFLARDGFMPRWLQNRGDRLVFSSGIVTLSVLASIIIVVFGADEIAMLPLYATGVMASFTLSQAGMVRLMEKVGRVPPGQTVDTGVTTIRFEPGWRWKRAVSAVGSVVTFVVLIILATTKFLDGGWIVVVAAPLLVLLFRGIHNHYLDVAAKLSTRTLEPEDLSEVADVVIIPIADVHRGTLRALKYARRLSNDIRVINVSQSPEARERIRERWNRFPELTRGAKLIFIDYQYRDILEPMIKYIQHVNNVEFPDQLTTVVVPEFIPHSFLDQLLHNQTANLLRWRLRPYPDVVIIQVPHHV